MSDSAPPDHAQISPPPPPQPEAIPAATLTPRRRLSWTWLIPLLALAAAAGLVYQSISLRGVVVTIQFDEGHGIAEGDAIRFRGTHVGSVRKIELRESLESVLVTASMTQQGEAIARRGARFWVVRPEIRFSGIEGLETLLGPRYMEVLPGTGAPQTHFIGLEDAPIDPDSEAGNLEVLVRSPRQGSLLRGAPVVFRGIEVGVILSVGLTSDGGSVEARLLVRKRYAPLVRQNSRFWRIGGVKAEIGLSGVAVDIDSLPTLIKGGVSFATPPQEKAGQEVVNGHRFLLAAQPREEWLRWEPLVPVGNDLLPAGSAIPAMLSAKLGWRQGLIFRGSRSRKGWILTTERGVLAPLDLLEPSDRAKEQSVVLEIAGATVPLPDEEAITWRSQGLALTDLDLPGDIQRWPDYRSRRPTKPEDCIAVGDPNAPSLPLSADRLGEAEDSWLIDRAVSLGRDWHGAAVLARADGKLVGMIIIDDDEARVSWIP